ncbi:MAG: ribosomal protein [Bacteroidetes bacterium]|nr:ribosomal protein [Bacteroidota bacterium]
MGTTSRTYETTFIVNASLDDAQVEAVIGRVQETITKNGGTIKAVNKWGRKRLAYAINKRTNGFYVNVEFDAPGTVLAHLERAYQLDEMVLRNLTIILDKKAIAARAAALAAAPPVEEKPAAPPATGREPLFTEEPKNA